MKFRKLPVVIDAIQLTPATTPDDIAVMVNCPEGSTYASLYADYAYIHTLEGVMRADMGDWIIKGVAGEFYPCKPDIFDATYEAVE